MNYNDLDAERRRLLSICADVTSDVLKSDKVAISAKVEAAAEFVETAREILERQETQ